MTATLTSHYGAIALDDPDLDADRRTQAAKVPNGEAMTELLGRAYSAPSRADFGILWGGNGGDTTGYPFIDRRVIAVGAGEGGEVTAWTKRTAAGSLDGATAVRA